MNLIVKLYNKTIHWIQQIKSNNPNYDYYNSRRVSLLKQLDNGAFESKKLKREKVKEVLLSYRTCLVKGRESNFS